jgi:POT family proton-dependent oligopeptide transporter
MEKVSYLHNFSVACYLTLVNRQNKGNRAESSRQSAHSGASTILSLQSAPYRLLRLARPAGQELRLSFSQRLKEIRDGFEPAFWVANISEIFERLAYYGAFSSLANYLHESLNIPTEQTGSLAGLFGGMVWFLAILGGAVADRLGFRRALSLAYLILACAYFLLGSLGAAWMAPVRSAVPLLGLVAFVLVLPALGISMVKPCVVGTTARASRENVRSIGYSIYYTLVNIGGAAGPYIASWSHRHLGVENVFRVSALSVLLMFFAVLLFFKEPRHSGEIQTASLIETARNLFTVMTNPRFMLFLLIFSGYWIVFWQQFIVLPIYIHGYINPHADVELILITDAVTVICLQFLVTYLTQKIPAFRAITIGTLISALGWLIVASRPAVWAVVLSLFVVALGEITLSPRYYEYVSRLAPPGQQGTYMGFAFVPIGIGSLVGGWLGGRLMHHFGEVVQRPAQVWWAITGIGIGTTLLMWLYHFVVKTDLPAAAS